MKIFVAGGTGVVGRRAVPALVAQGHDVTVLARSSDKARLVRSLGAVPAEVSLFDPEALASAVAGHDVVVNMATSIPPFSRAARKRAWAMNDRIRREGSKNLVDAALAAGASRYVQESVTFLYADGGDDWIGEDHPLAPNSITASALDAEAEARRFADSGGTAVILRSGRSTVPTARIPPMWPTWPAGGWRRRRALGTGTCRRSLPTMRQPPWWSPPPRRPVASTTSWTTSR